MRRIPGLVVGAIAFLASAGCATTMTVSSHVERGLDFSPYRTFDWGPADALPTRGPAAATKTHFKDHVQGAVEKQLITRGIGLSTSSGTPDLLIHYHANIRYRIDVNRVDRAYGYCSVGDCPADRSIRGRHTGTGRHRCPYQSTIWRGWAQNSVEDMLDEPDRMARTINEAVTRMMGRVPQTL